MSSHCFCTCVHLCLLPKARQQQLCLIVTKPPRPQLDWSHRYRALLVGDRRGGGKSALIWVGLNLQKLCDGLRADLAYNERRELGFLGLHWLFETAGCQCIPVTKTMTKQKPHSTTMFEFRHFLPSSVPRYVDVALRFFSSWKFMFKSFIVYWPEKTPSWLYYTDISHTVYSPLLPI